MPQPLAARRHCVRAALYADETEVAQGIAAQLNLSEFVRADISAQGRAIVQRARGRKAERSVLENFLQEFGLSSDEGITLLSLAEALLRVPDSGTADNLIAEKIHKGDWARHRGRSDSKLVNLATRSLMLTSTVVDLDGGLEELGVRQGARQGAVRALVRRLGEPAVRLGVRRAIAMMGDEFVLGHTIEEALARADKNGALASFDMLGEGARTDRDARRHFAAYQHAMRATAGANGRKDLVRAPGGLFKGHGVSVKLSALHPRYEYLNAVRVTAELLPRVRALALQARECNLQLTIDAEEAARLDLSLDIFEALARDPELSDWQGLGLALQCYSKRALGVLDWLIVLAGETRRRLVVRFVKGAYWDSEIKRAQEAGTAAYPVFTRKVTTDLSYLACARAALANPNAIYAQFATHNAQTISAVMAMAGAYRDFEFQRLHGMGELLYSAAREVFPDLPQVRVYAPVGAHRDLLAYLVRRLLENGANTSFVNHFMDESVSIETLIEDPIEALRALTPIPNPRIPSPVGLYGSARRNSSGIDLNDVLQTGPLLDSLRSLRLHLWQARPVISGASVYGQRKNLTNPADSADVVGEVVEATGEDVNKAVDAAVRAQPSWDRAGADERARVLEAAATALETERAKFLSLLTREAGKTADDAIAELREAVDFCRYYAAQARQHFGEAQSLASPTGERNLYSLHGRGAWVCISPWNFPLAIFLGQITAALAAGNSVLAKPAEQTPLVAAAAIELLQRAGVPKDVLHLLPGTGEIVGAALVADERIAGVVMTGSTATAKSIARTLALREGPIIPLIAETGGQNAMFVDSTALPEQVVDDVIRSAFHSAGQRCSALRVLFLQEDIADSVIEMLKGAMNELKIGNPADLSVDVGPVIDAEARAQLMLHVAEMSAGGRLLHTTPLGSTCDQGSFVAPHLFALESVDVLKREHFGPLLHVVRYRAEDLDMHLSRLRATGYGLTLGVHTRIEARALQIFEGCMAGNVYVNRNMIGAVVGVQPFGGSGLSGTGPKAGGPLYLQRFATERVLTVNTTATGGNVDLLRQ